MDEQCHVLAKGDRLERENAPPPWPGHPFFGCPQCAALRAKLERLRAVLKRLEAVLDAARSADLLRESESKPLTDSETTK